VTGWRRHAISRDCSSRRRVPRATGSGSAISTAATPPRSRPRPPPTSGSVSVRPSGWASVRPSAPGPASSMCTPSAAGNRTATSSAARRMTACCSSSPVGRRTASRSRLRPLRHPYGSAPCRWAQVSSRGWGMRCPVSRRRQASVVRRTPAHAVLVDLASPGHRSARRRRRDRRRRPLHHDHLRPHRVDLTALSSRPSGRSGTLPPRRPPRACSGRGRPTAPIVGGPRRRPGRSTAATRAASP
jgi:hypothetical protein